jgi:hypothetical protein
MQKIPHHRDEREDLANGLAIVHVFRQYTIETYREVLILFLLFKITIILHFAFSRFLTTTIFREQKFEKLYLLEYYLVTSHIIICRSTIVSIILLTR